MRLYAPFIPEMCIRPHLSLNAYRHTMEIVNNHLLKMTFPYPNVDGEAMVKHLCLNAIIV